MNAEDRKYIQSRRPYWRGIGSHYLYGVQVKVWAAAPVGKLDRLIQERRTKKDRVRRPSLRILQIQEEKEK